MVEEEEPVDNSSYEALDMLLTMQEAEELKNDTVLIDDDVADCLPYDEMQEIEKDEARKKEEERKKKKKDEDKQKTISVPLEKKKDIPIVPISGVKEEQKKKDNEQYSKSPKDNTTRFRVGFESYLRFDVNGHKEIWRVDTERFRNYYRSLYGGKKKDVNEYLEKLEGEILKNGVIKELKTRVASIGDINNGTGEIWYDLTNTKWEAVRIWADPDGQGWEICEPPVLFYRWEHQLVQVYPTTMQDIRDAVRSLDLLFYSERNNSGLIRLKDDNQRFLYAINLITKFVPDIPHTIDLSVAHSGAAKSTTDEYKKMIVDPSSVRLFGYPTDLKELVLNIYHHWFICFDNINDPISRSVSDIFSTVITGTGITKRKLWTDGDEFILPSFKHCISINGIINSLVRPDIISRTIYFSLESLSDEERKPLRILRKYFEDIRPKILGGIFTIISKAMYIKKSVNLPSFTRMADFMEWAYCISETMEKGGGKRFMELYKENIKDLNQDIMNEDIVALTITNTLKKKKSFGQQPLIDVNNDELYKVLHDMYQEYLQDVKPAGYVEFPKNKVDLGMKLSDITTVLRENGIEIFDFRETNKAKNKVERVKIIYMKDDVDINEYMSNRKKGTKRSI